LLLIIAGNLELIIAKRIRQFGALLLLSKRLQLGNYELLNNRWQSGFVLSLNICWQFWRPLIDQTETIELVAFIGLGGVNYVFSHISLILVATFIF
jgi:hypothetical protein